MVAAELCWSTGGILVRSVTVTYAWEVVFWRALFMAAFIGVLLTVRHRTRAIAQITAVGLPGVLAGVMLALSFCLFDPPVTIRILSAQVLTIVLFR